MYKPGWQGCRSAGTASLYFYAGTVPANMLRRTSGNARIRAFPMTFRDAYCIISFGTKTLILDVAQQETNQRLSNMHLSTVVSTRDSCSN